MHEMRLSQPDATVDEQGVVGCAGRLRDLLAGGARQLVVGGCNICFKRVPGVNMRRRTLPPSYGCRPINLAGLRLSALSLLDGIADPHSTLTRDLTEHLLK